MPQVRRLTSPRPRLAVPPRESPRLRGYNARWDAYSKKYRQKHPFCAMCHQGGRMTFADLVDHKFPVADGGEMFPGFAGLWSLCVPCHGVKGALEQLARSTGQMEQLVRWCDEPQVRPRVF